jgi:hypothetical protein
LLRWSNYDDVSGSYGWRRRFSRSFAHRYGERGEGGDAEQDGE